MLKLDDNVAFSNDQVNLTLILGHVIQAISKKWPLNFIIDYDD